ncbi:UNVERIFIED_CONTAM: hypothetical protein Sangu_2882800 [Sesamum angustifolium]|uniref:Uncharacterized protein n=1 Tax=Sesamum angustifolium TaxID=2727405 RepID=A0AAW2ING0_9LAMI
MDFKDHTELFPSIVIRSSKDNLKVKGTTHCIHELAKVIHLSKSRFVQIFAYPQVRRVMRDALDPRSSVSFSNQGIVVEVFPSRRQGQYRIYPFELSSSYRTTWIPQSSIENYWEWTKDMLGHHATSFTSPRSIGCARISYHTTTTSMSFKLSLIWCPL